MRTSSQLSLSIALLTCTVKNLQLNTTRSVGKVQYAEQMIGSLHLSRDDYIF